MTAGEHDLEVVYDLRQDHERVSIMEDLSKDQTRAGSPQLPIEAIEGKVNRVHWTGMGGHPSFEITSDSGTVHSFSRYGDITRYSWGLRARVELVELPWKSGVTQAPSSSTHLVTRILLGPTSARSDPRSPGPYGPMLAREHEGSRSAWGLRCFEHWLEIEQVNHRDIAELLEHLWAWLTVTQQTFNDWYDHPAKLVDSRRHNQLRSELSLEAAVERLLTQALHDATALAYNDLFAGFDHDQNVQFAAALGRLLDPLQIALPDPQVFGLAETSQLPQEWGPIPRGTVASWRAVPIPWPLLSTVSITTQRHIPEGANPGDLGVIVEVHPDAYEIEITDFSGKTVFLGAIAHGDVGFHSYKKPNT